MICKEQKTFGALDDMKWKVIKRQPVAIEGKENQGPQRSRKRRSLSSLQAKTGTWAQVLEEGTKTNESKGRAREKGTQRGDFLLTPRARGAGAAWMLRETAEGFKGIT